MKNKAGPSAVQRVQELANRATLNNREAQRRAAHQIILEPDSFERDFNLVAEHFKLKEAGEYDQAKQMAQDAGSVARVCYQSIANSIRGTLALGINERMRMQK